jgi:hypothetical protein
MSADPRRLSGRRYTGPGLTAAGFGALVNGAGRRDLMSGDRRTPPRPVSVPFISTAKLLNLPEVTFPGALVGAPPDDRHDRSTSGRIVHPCAPLPVFDAVGGTAVARIRPARQGAETWLPVIEQQPGWARVLLPSRPGGITGWLDASRVTSAYCPYAIHLDVRAGELRLLHDSGPAGSWPAALGVTSLSVPVGRTFLLTCVRRAPRTPRVLLRLAPPINERDPGLLTIHAGPAPVSEPTERSGVRVPEHAMSALQAVPPGCLVRIDAGSTSGPSRLRHTDIS